MIVVNTMVEVLRGELIYRRGYPIEACRGAAGPTTAAAPSSVT